MNKRFLMFMFIASILCVVFSSSVMASDSHASWTSNNDVVLNINNGQSAEFEYGVHAITSRNGHYTIAFFREGNSVPLRTFINNQPTVANGADGYFNVTPLDYAGIPGNYYVSIYSVDGFSTNNFRISLSVSPAILPPTPVLTVQSINCFPRVVRGNNQSCSVFVTSSNNQNAGNVNVNIYYTGGNLFGSCRTNSISGGCSIISPVNSVGTFTVYATANAPGYINYTATDKTFSFEVYNQKYQIMNLATYNDSNFLNPDSTFYRGEPLYAKFQVYNPTTSSFVTSDIVTAATLVSLPGGRVDLSRMTYNGNWYYYKLDRIPLTHAFLGDSNVFAFAFNFTDASGGEAQVSLNILNNNPRMISSIPDVYLNVGQSSQISLNNYASDLEDNILRWTITNVPSKISANIGAGNILLVTGNTPGIDTIALNAYDLDNAYISTTITVHVNSTPIIPANDTNVTAVCIPNNLFGTIPMTVYFTTLAVGGTAPYMYGYNYGTGFTITGRSNIGGQVYVIPGIYTTSVTVTDSLGKTAFVPCGYIIVNGNQTYPVNQTNQTNQTNNNQTNQTNWTPNLGLNPYTAYINVPLNVETFGNTSSVIKYKWEFGDGTSSEVSMPFTQHTYTAIDRFTLKVTAYYVDGKTASATTTVTVIDGASPAKTSTVNNLPDRGIVVQHLAVYGDSGDVFKTNDDVNVEVTMKNYWNTKLKDTRVDVSIPELGIESRSSSIDLGRGAEETESLILSLYDVPPGTYYLKITAGNDDVRRIKYREIIVRK